MRGKGNLKTQNFSLTDVHALSLQLMQEGNCYTSNSSYLSPCRDWHTNAHVGVLCSNSYMMLQLQ